MKLTRLANVAATLAILGFASMAHAQSRFSFAANSAGNEDEFGWNSGAIAMNSGFSSSGNAVTANTNKNFTGEDSWGDQQTMNVSASSFATAEYGILKTRAAATITNPFFSSSNPWYWNPNTSQVNEETGVPDYFLFAGTASYNDTFSYTGLGAGFTVNFFYHVDGRLIGDAAYTTLWVTNNGVTEYFDVEADENGFVSQTFVTQKYTPNANSQIVHTTSLTSGVVARLYDMNEGGVFSAESDFDSTVTMTGMAVYDASGNIVSGWTVDSLSGTTYPVPEPATMSILGVAALAAIRNKRKKS